MTLNSLYRGFPPVQWEITPKWCECGEPYFDVRAGRLVMIDGEWQSVGFECETDTREIARKCVEVLMPGDVANK